MNLVSVIITTKNSQETIRDLLESVKSQSYPNIETILVDNQSIDGTLEIGMQYTKKIFSKGPERSAQRNFGAEKARGKYLFFLDSDMVLGRGVLQECINKFEARSTCLAGWRAKYEIGGVVIPEKSFGKGIWAKAKALERKINEGESFFEAARFFPRKVFEEMGGYDLSMTGPEDWEFPQKVGDKYKVARIKSYIRHNEGELSLSTLIRKKYYYGLTAHKYLKKRRLPIVGSTTIYFLRPAFYRRWKLFFKNPVISLAMFFMLGTELVAGGLGYLVGRLKSFC